MKNDKKYWFPKREQGPGWGLPLTGEGWIVLLIFLAVLIPDAIWFTSAVEPGTDPPVGVFVKFLLIALADSIFLLIFCLRKGEPRH